MDFQLLIYSTLGALLLIAIVVGIFFLRTNSLIKNKKYCKSKLNGMLKSYASLRKYKILRNVEIKTDKGNVVCDFILIGIFGVYIFNCIEAHGEVYCNEKSDKWVVSRKEKSSKIANPVKHLDECVMAVRNVFAKNKIYSIQVDASVAYEPGKAKVCDVAKLPVYSIKKLKDILTRDRYNKENNVDIERLEKALLNANQ